MSRVRKGAPGYASGDGTRVGRLTPSTRRAYCEISTEQSGALH